ncbi:MAG: hypothetical protein U5P41_11950 [Gammaproteobacteria bacterium]|nr:hypothetical protein [Gammaproteobacteria bacterium]
MKKLITLTILAMILAPPLAMADEQHHEGKGEKSHEMGMQEGMMDKGGMMNHDAMQERMQTMRETMQEIRNTQDPAERQRLMQAHMQQMRDVMGKMKGMSEHHEGRHEQMMEMDGERCKKMMEMHSKMMQGMMEQMDARMQMQSGEAKGND